MGIRAWKVICEFYSILKHALCAALPVYNVSVASKASASGDASKASASSSSPLGLADMLPPPPRVVERVPDVQDHERFVKVEDCMARLFAIYSPSTSASTSTSSTGTGSGRQTTLVLDPEMAMLRATDQAIDEHKGGSKRPAPPPPPPPPPRSDAGNFKATYRSWIRPVKEEFQRFGAQLRAYVLVCDKSEYVGSWKQREQAKRSAAASCNPFPVGSTFVDDGIRLPDGQVALFEVRRIMQSRDMRRALYDNFLREMRNDPELNKMRIVFDYHVDGPFALFDGECVQLPELKNTYGEADIAAWHWALAYAPQNHVTVRCIDRDLLLVGLAHVDKFPLSVYYQQGNTESYHLQYIAAQMREAKYSIDALLLTAMVLDCDYVEKKTVFAQIGDQAVIKAIHEYINVEGHRNVLDSFDHYKQMIAYVHEHYGTARSRFPSDEDIRASLRDVEYCMWYWKTLDGSYACTYELAPVRVPVESKASLTTTTTTTTTTTSAYFTDASAMATPAPKSETIWRFMTNKKRKRQAEALVDELGLSGRPDKDLLVAAAVAEVEASSVKTDSAVPDASATATTSSKRAKTDPCLDDEPAAASAAGAATASSMTMTEAPLRPPWKTGPRPVRSLADELAWPPSSSSSSSAENVKRTPLGRRVISLVEDERMCDREKTRV